MIQTTLPARRAWGGEEGRLALMEVPSGRTHPLRGVSRLQVGVGVTTRMGIVGEMRAIRG